MNLFGLKSRLAVLMVCLIWSSVGSAQTLNGIRNEVREPARPSANVAPLATAKKKRPKRKSARHADFDDDDNPVGDLVGNMFLAAASAPFVVPRAALHDEGGPGYYPDYPYDANAQGLVFDEAPPGVHSSLIVLQADYGTDLDSLSHAHGRLFGDMALRLGFDTEFYYRNEDLTAGNDDLWNGDFNLTWRFAQNEFWQFRAGLGVNWLHDQFGSDAGFNSTYSVEWFPTDPMVLASQLDWGRVGDSSLLHFRSTVGVTHNGWGLFTGYDYLKIGRSKIHAWVNGLEYRF